MLFSVALACKMMFLKRISNRGPPQLHYMKANRNYKQHEVDWLRASYFTSDYIYKILARKEGKDKFLYVWRTSMGLAKSKQKR